MATPNEAPPAEPAEPPAMPPRDEPGFPALPWAAGGVAELFGSVTPNRMFSVSCAVRDSLAATGMGMMHQGQAAGQVGLQYASPLGLLKAELVSAGMVNVSLEGFQPLPFAQLNTQLAFVGGMLAGGQLHSVLMTPFGVLMGAANVFGQLSAEVFTGMQPAEGHQVMAGVHAWGLPGVFGGVKAAVEWSREVIVDEQLQSHCTITAAVTRPHLTNDGAPGAPSYTLSVCNRMSADQMLALQFESGAQGSLLALGGARALSDAQRLKARWNTQGILGIALEQVGERSSLTLCGEVDSSPATPLRPKFGVTLQISA